MRARLKEFDVARKPRLAVVSPFVDKQHGTEMCLAEQIDRLAEEYEIHLYSARAVDIDLSRIQFHRVPALPGPHLVAYLGWFGMNSVMRWWHRRRRGLIPDLVYSPGINCFDADVISVHIVFAEFHRQVEKSLRFLDHSVKAWPLLAHRRMYYAIIRALERRVYPRANLPLVAVSRKVADDLGRFYGRTENVHLAYHGCDVERFCPRRRGELRERSRRDLGLGQAEFAVLLIGNDWRKKGVGALLQAAARVADPSLRILICGTDDTTPYRSLLEQQDIAGRVQFLPPRRDVEFYYAAADAYAGPSLEDAFALPPLEAMACGLPVIVSRQAGVSEVISHGVDGMILEDPEDIPTLAGWIRKIMEDAKFRAGLVENAVRTAQGLTWERNALTMKAIFEQALQSMKRHGNLPEHAVAKKSS